MLFGYKYADDFQFLIHIYYVLRVKCHQPTTNYHQETQCLSLCTLSHLIKFLFLSLLYWEANYRLRIEADLAQRKRMTMRRRTTLETSDNKV